MKKFKKLFKQVTKSTHMDMLRDTDLNVIKELLMDTELFEGVETFNIPYYGDGKDIHSQYFEPNVDKLNKDVDIFNIQMGKHDGFIRDGWYLNIVCKEGTIIRPEK